MTSTLDDRIRSAFGEFAVDKGLIRRMGVSGDDRHVPSYVMDWIVTYTAKTQKTTSSLERAVQEFIAKHLPAKGEKELANFATISRKGRHRNWVRPRISEATAVSGPGARAPGHSTSPPHG